MANTSELTDSTTAAPALRPAGTGALGRASTVGLARPQGEAAGSLAALVAAIERLPSAASSALDVAVEVLAEFEHDGAHYQIPRVRIRSRASNADAIRLGLFAGLHGDEPAGCWALVRLVEALVDAPERVRSYDLYVYPLLNPTGYERGTRCNHAGKDLNREFWRHSAAIEVRCIEAELRAQTFAGIITLHADDTCEGVYGYTHGRTLNEALLAPALEAAQPILPIDARAVIDGFPARAGLICECFSGVLSAPPEQRPKPFDLIFETPACAPLHLQVRATVAALEAILAAYPGFISYAQDI